MSHPSFLFRREHHGNKVLLVGWQTANISKLPEPGRYEVGVIAVDENQQIARAFLDLSADELDSLLIEDNLSQRAEREINVMFNVNPPTIRPMLGEVVWMAADNMAVVRLLAVGDFKEQRDAMAGMLTADLSTIPEELRENATIYPSLGYIPRLLGFMRNPIRVCEDDYDRPGFRWDVIPSGPMRYNPVHESRLTGLLTMAIWPTDDVNEADNAKRLALNILNKAIADDINELKLIFRKVIGQAGSHLGSNEQLEAIWEEATNQNPELTISYRELLGEREKKPAKKKAKKKKPTKKKTTYRRTRRSGVCILCGEDSRGKPYCRRHYYEFIGREYYETCQVPGCDNLSFGQPKCREHYYGGRRRTRRRRPRKP